MKYIPMLLLTAEEGMVLTNGKRITKEVDIEAADLELWKEIPEEE